MTSATGCSSRRIDRSGFTLIELLIVLLILGILSTLVALSTAPNTRRETANEAIRLRVVLEMALQEAQLSGRPIAWIAQGTSYRFMQGDLERRWQAVTGDEYLRPRNLVEGMRIAGIAVDGQPLPADAFLIFASTATPLFEIQLDSPQGVFILRARPNGRVDLFPPTSS